MGRSLLGVIVALDSPLDFVGLDSHSMLTLELRPGVLSP